MDSDVKHMAAFWQAWAWVEKNRKQVTYALAAAIIIGLVVWFIVWKKEQTQIQASEALAKVSIGQMTNPNIKKDAANSFLKVASEYPSSDAGQRAVLQAAAALFTEGKYAEAQTQFGRFVRENGGSPFVAQAKLGVAASFEAQGKMTEAISSYKDVAEKHPNDSAAPQARLALGRLYEAQNQPELAHKYYSEVSRGDMYGSLGSEAAMRLEELNRKHPNLAAKPASATSVPSTNRPAVTISPATNQGAVRLTAPGATNLSVPAAPKKAATPASK